MADNENIHDDIREMRGLLINISKEHVATNTKLDTLLDRELPALWQKAKDAESTASQAKAIASKTAAQVKNQRVAVASYAAGASGAIVGLKWLAAKLGIHFV